MSRPFRPIPRTLLAACLAERPPRSAWGVNAIAMVVDRFSDQEEVLAATVARKAEVDNPR
jgi:hypothetical protein